MKLKVFAIYDAAVGAYMQPFYVQSKGQAIRMWLDTVSDEKTQFNKHPADFTLFELGEYDEESGTHTNLKTPESLGTALSLLSRNSGGVGVLTPEMGNARDPDVAKKLNSVRRAVENHSERNA